MDATRVRLRLDQDHLGEYTHWASVAALLLAVLLLASLIVRELRFAPRAFDSNEVQSASSSTGVPQQAVSVPTLVLAPGREVHVGEARPGVSFAGQCFER